jgi:hypothetical protein
MNDIIDNLKNSEGQILRWPKKKSEKIEVLKYINTKFSAGKKYSEREVNEIISKWHCFNDYALIRREMYDNYFLERTPDGKEYWINESTVNKE